ncbi:enoyl-CoA hydratase [Neobacillus niacini]|uniref:enoyl-CoA hydratase/isomerase family protein n=1 Tax=Neobacillus niacini TaxID=86668 RepID=UPI002862BE76|nr:enoyl-CoA hydratase/isomerase family protein [Neobacillus niacini]MDR7079762.1 enoyl-CoA hydratase [Neobacillus niacini]
MTTDANNFETIDFSISGNIAVITMSRPQHLNAISEQLTKDVWNALDLVDSNKNIRAVILTGANNNFSAGADLKETFDLPTPIGEEPSEVWRNHLESLLRVSMKMWNLRVPVIAAVDGYALGGAADWVLSADVAIASDKAIFGEPEIRFGAAPGTLMMPWVLGIRKAKELLFTGDSVDAEEGYRIGVYNKVVPQVDLMKESFKLAEKMANIPPSALKITKVTINKIYEMMNIKESLDYNLEAAISMFFLNSEKQTSAIGSKIKDEGLKSFLSNANKEFD